MKSLNLFLILSTLLFISCKTAEQIKSEKMVTTVNEQISQGQKLNADTQARLVEVEERLSQLAGKIEEKKYKDDQKNNEVITNLTEHIRMVEEKQKSLESELKEQKEYISQLLETIKKFTTQEKISPKEKKEANHKDDFTKGLELFKEKKMKEAHELLENALEDKNLPAKKKAVALFTLGSIEYTQKKYNSASEYLGRLYSDYPKSSLVPSGLLLLGKSFKNLKQHEKADITFEELITSFPKSKEAQAASKLRKQN